MTMMMMMMMFVDTCKVVATFVLHLFLASTDTSPTIHPSGTVSSLYCATLSTYVRRNVRIRVRTYVYAYVRTRIRTYVLTYLLTQTFFFDRPLGDRPSVE